MEIVGRVWERTLKPELRAVRNDLYFRLAVRRAGRHSNARASSNATKIAFVIGCGRSGTSLLGQLLGRHPSVRYCEEPYHLWAALDPELDFTNQYARGNARCIVDGAAVTNEMRARFDTLFLSRLPHGKDLVEKTPINSMRIGLLDELVDGARFIHIARDGTEVARSISHLADTNCYQIARRPNYNMWWGTSDAKWRSLIRDGTAAGYFPNEVGVLDGNRQRAAYEWLVSLLEVDRWRPILGARLFEVTYGELTSEPAHVLTQISEFLDLPPSESWIREACAVVRPNKKGGIERLALPPRMSEAFNEYSARFGFPGRAVADPA